MEKCKAEMAEIKTLLEYQRKLIEEMYQTLNEIMAQKSKAMPNVEAMMGMISDNPFVKNNPAIQNMIRGMFPGAGGSNGG